MRPKILYGGPPPTTANLANVFSAQGTPHLSRRYCAAWRRRRRGFGVVITQLQNCAHHSMARDTTADTQAIGELRLRRVSARNCSGAYSRNCSGAYFCMKLEEAVISYLLRQSAKNHDREAALPPSDRRAKSVWRCNQDRSNCVRCRGRSESAGH